jgi:hypothetical protein
VEFENKVFKIKYSENFAACFSTATGVRGRACENGIAFVYDSRQPVYWRVFVLCSQMTVHSSRIFYNIYSSVYYTNAMFLLLFSFTFVFKLE